MRLLCLGLSRTGTESLRAALRQLGCDDVYHGFSAYAENPPDLVMWLEAFQAKYEGKGKPFTRDDWD